MMMTSRTAQSRTSRDRWSSATGGRRRRDQVSRQDQQFRADPEDDLAASAPSSNKSTAIITVVDLK
jgi:hypothetical protein